MRLDGEQQKHHRFGYMRSFHKREQLHGRGWVLFERHIDVLRK